VLRRIETYSLRPDAAPAATGLFERALRECGRHIPEVLDGVVGWNDSDAPVHLVWEHAYASPEAYRRYMVHPYHATVLDRYILQDSPECVVAPDVLGAGLVGYHCDEPSYRMEEGVRRIVLLRMDAGAAAADVARVCHALRGVPAGAGSMGTSVVGANTLGPAWFDGVTPITGPPRWTHLWEQGFASAGACDEYRRGPAPLAAVERAGRDGWAAWSDGIVRSVAELRYELGAPRPHRTQPPPA